MKRALGHILFCCFTGLALYGQHSGNYSQYMFNALLLNPAYAGSQDALNLTALYRSQWAGIDGAPKALSFTAHSPLRNKKLNLGFMLETEQLGLFSRAQAKLAYAFRIPLREGGLALGIQAGVDGRSFNRNNLRVRDSDDPSFNGSGTSTLGLLAGSGIYYSSPRFYLGVAAPELLAGDQTNFSILQLHAGGLLSLSDAIAMKPSALLRHVPASPLLGNLTMTTYYKEVLGIGIGYTHQASWMAFIDCRLTEQLNFGYAYERSTGQLAGYNSGSHEVMLRYLFRYRITAINPRYF